MEKKRSREFAKEDVLVIIESRKYESDKDIHITSLKIKSNIYENIIHTIRLNDQQAKKFNEFLKTVAIEKTRSITSILDWNETLWYFSNCMHNPLRAARKWNSTRGKEINNAILKELVFNFIHTSLKKDIQMDKNRKRKYEETI